MKRREKSIRSCTDCSRFTFKRSMACGSKERICTAAVVEGLEQRRLLSFTPAPSSPLALPVGTSPYKAASADFNSDGKNDIVVADYLSNQVTLCLGQGDGTFGAPISFPAGPKPSGIV